MNSSFSASDVNKRKTPRNRVGMFITDKNIKIAKVAGGRPLLMKVPLEEKIVEDGRVADEGKFTAVLSKIARQLNLTKTEVVLGISEKHVFSKKLILSDGESDFEQKIADELESYLPSDASQAYTDWQVLEKREDQETISFASASVNVLDSYLALFERAHISLVGIEPISFAIGRYVPKQVLISKAASAAKTSTKSTGVQVPQVEQKPNTPPSTLVVFLDESDALLTIVDEKGRAELTSVLPQASLGHVNELVSEISDMRTFYDKKSASPIGKVYVTGEGATEEVKNQLNQQLGLPSDFLRIPSPSIPVQNAIAFFPIFALLDLPIAAPKDHKHINLLPEEMLVAHENEKNAAKRASFLFLAMSFFGILCLLYGAILTYLLLDSHNVKAEISKKTEAFSAGETLITRQKIASINKEIGVVKEFKERTTSSLDVLSFLAEKTPGGVTITHYVINSSSNTVMLTGQSLDRELLLAFKAVFESEPRYKNVKIPLTSLEKRGGSSFSLSFEMK